MTMTWPVSKKGAESAQKALHENMLIQAAPAGLRPYVALHNASSINEVTLHLFIALGLSMNHGRRQKRIDDPVSFITFANSPLPYDIISLSVKVSLYVIQKVTKGQRWKSYMKNQYHIGG